MFTPPPNYLPGERGDTMSAKSRKNQRQESVLSTIHTGGKLLFFIGIFLLLLEIPSLFGATNHASRVVDVMALMLTCLLLVLSLVGTRIVAFFFKRLVKEPKEPNAL